jgi:hypothetical protein
MADLPTQFTTAKSKVEPVDDDRKNAATAHADVRAVLERDAQLSEWGVDTILIGSYKRQVSIRRVKDVDVLSKFEGLPTDKTAPSLLRDIAAVLRAEYDTEDQIRVKPQDHSIKVLFPDFDMHVDVVPARSASPYLEIPSRNDDESEGWRQTNPEQLTALSSAMNARYDGEYVPLVKLVRQARRVHLGRRGKPGGLFFELLAYHAFDGALDDSSTAALFTGALRSAATQLSNVVAGGAIADPTMPGAVLKVRATPEQFAKAAEKFAELATAAEEALAEDDRCVAAKRFREILGKNDDDEWVFEMPAACNEDGTARAVAVISAGDRYVPAGDGRFA